MSETLSEEIQPTLAEVEAELDELQIRKEYLLHLRYQYLYYGGIDENSLDR